MDADPRQDSKVATLAQTLHDAPSNAASLTCAAQLVAAGQGRPLFDALLATWRQNEDEDAAVVAMMSSLEKMMDANPGVAGYFMARLHPVAGRRYLRFAHAVVLGAFFALAACREPRARANAESPAEHAGAWADLVVALADDGTLRLNGTQVPLDGLRAAVRTPTGRDSTIRVEASATTEWGRIVAVLDAMKSAGAELRYVLSVPGDGARKTDPFCLPKGADSGRLLLFPVPGAATPRTITSDHLHAVAITREAAIKVDGAAPSEALASALAKLGDLRDAAVIVQAAAAAPSGAVVDAVVAVQRTGAAVAFGIQPVPTARSFIARYEAAEPPKPPPTDSSGARSRLRRITTGSTTVRRRFAFRSARTARSPT